MGKITKKFRYFTLSTFGSHPYTIHKISEHVKSESDENELPDRPF